MKIQIAPGQKLTLGFYIPADKMPDGGWRTPEDLPLDGSFTIEFAEDGGRITIKADEPDDQNREGIIYEASADSDDEDETVDSDIE